MDLWWGYKHVNDTLQAKRYFGPEDLKEAKEQMGLAFGQKLFLMTHKEMQLLKT